MSDPEEIEEVKAELIKAQDKKPIVVIVGDDLDRDRVIAKLKEEALTNAAIQGREFNVISRSDATPEQLKNAGPLVDYAAQERKAAALAVMAQHMPRTSMIEDVNRIVPTKRQIRHAHTVAARKAKHEAHKKEHNNPDVAAKYRAERIAKKKSKRKNK